jgi:hypothetical protein
MSPPEPGRWRRIVDGLHWVIGWAPWRNWITEGLLVAGVVAAVAAVVVLVVLGVRTPVPVLVSSRDSRDGEAARDPAPR